MNRRQAREEAFKLLFQMDMNDNHIVKLEKTDEFTQRIVDGVIEKEVEIDQILTDHLENWSLNRIALVEKAILRIATYEITFMEDIPFGVSINEAVELAHTYGDEKSGKFVNGVLSKLIKK